MINYLSTHPPHITITSEPQLEAADKYSVSIPATESAQSFPSEKISCERKDVEEQSEPLKIVCETNDRSRSHASSSTSSVASSATENISTATTPMTPVFPSSSNVNGLPLLLNSLPSTCPVFATPLDTIKAGWPSSWLETRFWNDQSLEDYINEDEGEDMVSVDHIGIASLYLRIIQEKSPSSWLDGQERNTTVMSMHQVNFSDVFYDGSRQKNDEAYEKRDEATTNSNLAREDNVEKYPILESESIGIKITKPTIEEPIDEESTNEETSVERLSTGPSAVEENTTSVLWLNPETVIYPCHDPPIFSAKEVSAEQNNAKDHPVKKKANEEDTASCVLWLNPETIIHSCDKYIAIHAEEVEVEQKVSEDTSKETVTEEIANPQVLWLNPGTIIDIRPCYPTLDTELVTAKDNALHDDPVMKSKSERDVTEENTSSSVLWNSPGIQIDTSPYSVISYAKGDVVEENIVEEKVVSDTVQEKSNVEDNTPEERIVEENVHAEHLDEEIVTPVLWISPVIQIDIRPCSSISYADEVAFEENIVGEEIVSNKPTRNNITEVNMARGNREEECIVEEHVPEVHVVETAGTGRDSEENIVEELLLEKLVNEKRIAEKNVAEGYVFGAGIAEDSIASCSSVGENSAEEESAEENIGEETASRDHLNKENVSMQKKFEATTTDETVGEQQHSASGPLEFKTVLLLVVVLLWSLW